MEVRNATAMVIAPPDSQFRLRPCGCGNDQPVYLENLDHQWRVECLECGKKTEHHAVRHDAQVGWNKGGRL